MFVKESHSCFFFFYHKETEINRKKEKLIRDCHESRRRHSSAKFNQRRDRKPEGKKQKQNKKQEMTTKWETKRSSNVSQR